VTVRSRVAATQRETEGQLFNKILIAIDASSHASRALVAGAEIANRFDAYVVVLHACPEMREEARLPSSGKVVQRLEENAQRMLGQARHTLWKQGVAGVELVCLPQKPVPAILRTSFDRQIDLIVMGSRGLGTMSSALLGGVSGRVAQRARCAVLLVR
jgi:nucleotide-binding universal stress UspA family protein